jgi:hypothetical protein
MPLAPLASARPTTGPEHARALPHPSYAREARNEPEPGTAPSAPPTPRWWQAPCPQGRGSR